MQFNNFVCIESLQYQSDKKEITANTSQVDCRNGWRQNGGERKDFPRSKL